MSIRSAVQGLACRVRHVHEPVLHIAQKTGAYIMPYVVQLQFVSEQVWSAICEHEHGYAYRDSCDHFVGSGPAEVCDAVDHLLGLL